jgi:hypothetical protein
LHVTVVGGGDERAGGGPGRTEGGRGGDAAGARLATLAGQPGSYTTCAAHAREVTHTHTHHTCARAHSEVVPTCGSRIRILIGGSSSYTYLCERVNACRYKTIRMLC